MWHTCSAYLFPDIYSICSSKFFQNRVIFGLVHHAFSKWNMWKHLHLFALCVLYEFDRYHCLSKGFSLNLERFDSVRFIWSFLWGWTRNSLPISVFFYLKIQLHYTKYDLNIQFFSFLGTLSAYIYSFFAFLSIKLFQARRSFLRRNVVINFD